MVRSSGTSSSARHRRGRFAFRANLTSSSCRPPSHRLPLNGIMLAAAPVIMTTWKPKAAITRIDRRRVTTMMLPISLARAIRTPREILRIHTTRQHQLPVPIRPSTRTTGSRITTWITIQAKPIKRLPQTRQTLQPPNHPPTTMHHIRTPTINETLAGAGAEASSPCANVVVPA